MPPFHEPPPSAGAAPVPGPAHLWNPIGFDPTRHLPGALHRHGDCARYLLHRIHYGAVFGLRDARGFVPLKAEYLRPFFPSGRLYKQIRDRLIASGAIVCDRHYVVGEKSYGYQLGEEYARVRHHRIVIADRTLARKVRAHRGGWVHAPEAVHRHLLRCLREVRIDGPAALQSLLDGDFVPADETAVQFLRDGELFFHVCAYGRVHTNLTNLKSGLRRFLSVRGLPLVNLDIRNSQPLVFAILLRERFGARGLPADVRRYVELVQAGRFYEHLMDVGGIPGDARPRFKRQFFGRVFFCPNAPVTAEARLFGRLFPHVAAVIREAKAEDYTALAKRLQRAESGVMIGRVARRCLEELPGAFLGTIHDSVLTTPDRADAIRSQVQEEFGRLGLVPTIRVEELRPPESQDGCQGFPS